MIVIRSHHYYERSCLGGAGTFSCWALCVHSTHSSVRKGGVNFSACPLHFWLIIVCLFAAQALICKGAGLLKMYGWSLGGRPVQFAEETKQADKTVPRAIMISILCTAVLGFCYVVALLFCIQVLGACVMCSIAPTPKVPCLGSLYT